MAVNKLSPVMLDPSAPYFGELEHDASVRITRPNGQEVSVTLARILELINAGGPGQQPTTIIYDGGEMEVDVSTVRDGGEMEDIVSVIHDGGEVVP